MGKNGAGKDWLRKLEMFREGNYVGEEGKGEVGRSNREARKECNVREK